MDYLNSNITEEYSYFIDNGYSRAQYKEYINAYIAIIQSQLSTSMRMKVGAVLTFNGYIISTGYNGSISGTSNKIEDENFNTDKLLSIHAEQNCIGNVDTSKPGVYILYCTHAPCVECLKLAIYKNINKIIYLEKYSDSEKLLKRANGLIDIERININVNLIYGIYIDDELVYVGSSINGVDRISSHYLYLNANKHANKKLQDYYNKSNKKILITVLKFCPLETERELRKKEYEYIKLYKPCCNLQINEDNVTKIMSGIRKREKIFGNGFLGKKHSKESRQKISNNRGKYDKEKCYQWIDVDMDKLLILRREKKTKKEIGYAMGISAKVVDSRLRILIDQGYSIEINDKKLKK